ncbi:microcephalin isoform X4 [Osmerus mordax]|uniref:microcephalin isoform X4 n=1 Tax=Osmerus mordax TaxID=8014 RepID=UPI0035100104
MTTNVDCIPTAILKDVVAYVDVWSSSKTENYSKPFIELLQEMGAEVTKRFNKQVTHVVFKNGHQATWNRAKKTGVRLVSVLWVERCKDEGEQVDEELCPALNEEGNPAFKKRTHRCMQPRETPEKTPDGDKRMKKKLDKMMKDLVPAKPLITDVSPFIIDEDNGIVYSPTLKRSDSMAKRLKVMKEKREKLSPTASQLVESELSSDWKPSLGSTPTCTFLQVLAVGRGTECDAADTAAMSERICEQKRQVNEKAKRMDTKTKTMRTLVMTSMPTEKQHIVIQVVKNLGGFSVVESVCESTTHVVSGGHKRTLNVLLGIARGCWILSFKWILWCLEQRQWIPEEPYELSDHFPAAPICRLQQHLSAGEHQQDLFLSQPTMFVSQLSQPPRHSLAELIQLCGGTVCKTVRQAGLCIGEHRGKRPEGSKILSEQWVLDCITYLKQLPYDNYELE